MARVAALAARARCRPRDPHPREPRQLGDAAGGEGRGGDVRGRRARRAQPGRHPQRRQRRPARPARPVLPAARRRADPALLLLHVRHDPGAEHWRISVADAQRLQHHIMGYLPGFATPRIVCDVPFVGKRWVHQLSSYDEVRGISYWTKNYRTSIEADRPRGADPHLRVLRPDPHAPPRGSGVVGRAACIGRVTLIPTAGRSRRAGEPAVLGSLAQMIATTATTPGTIPAM